MLGCVTASQLGWAEQTSAAYDGETVAFPHAIDGYTPDFFDRTFNAIGNLAKRAGSFVRFVFIDGMGKARALTLSFEKRGNKAHASPMLRSEDGKKIHLEHTGHSALHRVEFSNSNKEFVDRLRERSKHAWATLKSSVQGQDALTLGMKAVAIGIGVWIGIHVAGFVLAALGVFVYYALIVALILGGAMAIEALFQKRFSVHERMTHTKERFMQKTARFPELAATIAS